MINCTQKAPPMGGAFVVFVGSRALSLRTSCNLRCCKTRIEPFFCISARIYARESRQIILVLFKIFFMSLLFYLFFS